MREFVVLRVREDCARRIFERNECRRVGDGVCEVKVSSSDPRLAELRDLNQKMRTREGHGAFFWNSIEREYDPDELEVAEILQLWIWWRFEPAGEQCGTIYDESTACQHCGAGRRQASDLVLDLRKAPKKMDMACTIANEWIVSQRLAELIADEKVSGVELLSAIT